MGFVPPPFPEPWSVINDRWNELEKEGKLITLKNLDPRFWKWYQERQRFYKFQIIALTIGAGLFFVLYDYGFL